jgi:hypothetical protein
MTKFRKEGLAAELRSFSRLTVRLEYAPPQHPQRAQRVPTARLAEVLQFKKGPAGITILEHPSAVVFPPDFDQRDGFFQPLAALWAAIPKVVEAAQDSVCQSPRLVKRCGGPRVEIENHLARPDGHVATQPLRPFEPLAVQKTR